MTNTINNTRKYLDRFFPGYVLTESTATDGYDVHYEGLYMTTCKTLDNAVLYIYKLCNNKMFFKDHEEIPNDIVHEIMDHADNSDFITEIPLQFINDFVRDNLLK